MEPSNGAATQAITLPVSVVIPTIGRVDLLRSCLTSLASCVPRATEVLVVDQSEGSEVRELVESFADRGARWVPCTGRGIARGTNLGVRSARHDVVAVTHDDCTVEEDWLRISWERMQDAPETVFTGRVMPAGDPDVVPSTRTYEDQEEWVGVPIWGVLFPANMVFSRVAIQAFGGFDERPTLALAAEDNDFCYRWLKAGGRVVYEPTMVVWHHDWRPADALERMYVSYAMGQGAFYAKHLRNGDLQMLRFVWWDAKRAVRSLAAGWLRGRPRSTDPRRGLVVGLPRGLGRGWREAGRLTQPLPKVGWD